MLIEEQELFDVCSCEQSLNLSYCNLNYYL